MPPWIIVLSSAVAALVVATGIAVPEVLNAPPLEIPPILLQHLPALALVLLAVYALVATLMATASLIAEAVRARREFVSDHGNQAFVLGANQRGSLATRLARCAPSEARDEIARSHYILLARSHVFSAAIALAAIIGLGLAQDHGSLPFSSGTVPTISAVLVMVGVILLTMLGRIAIDVTAEPLLEAISHASAEHTPSDSLGRAIEAVERASEAIRSGGRVITQPVLLPERLVTMVEEGHRAVSDAVDRLSTSTATLETVIRSLVEAIETMTQTAAAQQRLTDDLGPALDLKGLPDLQAAVEQLTAVLQQLIEAPAVSAAAPVTSGEAIVAAGPVPARRAPATRLAGELRRLLQEINAG